MKGREQLQAGEPAGAAVQSPTNSPRRILVVDDDRYLCHLSAEVLIRHGYEVNAAGDGTAAWEELNANRYDLLITDNNMPRLTGVELIRKLRSACMALPVIMATTRRLPAEALGQNPPLQLAAMLSKPFSIGELLETVKKVLSEADRATAGSQPFKQRDMKDNNIAPAGEPAGVPRPRPANSPFRILVVDDDKDTRQNSFDVLVTCGYDVAAVKDDVIPLTKEIAVGTAPLIEAILFNKALDVGFDFSQFGLRCGTLRNEGAGKNADPH